MNARIFRAEVADELRNILREPTALFFSILMPVAFFVLFVSIFGGYESGGVSAGTRMLGTFGTFGVLAVTLINPGVGIADHREIGWLRAKRVSAVPMPLTLAAKVVAALPYAVGTLGAMGLAAWLTGSLDASVGQLLALAGVLLLGALPFALVSIAVGFRAGTNASVAILNAILLPMAVASGLWMPLEILPDFVGDLAPFLPAYHLREIATAQLGGGEVGWHVVVLLGLTAVAAGLAALSYRHARL